MDMTPEQRAALDRAKGPQKDPYRVHMPGRFKGQRRKVHPHAQQAPRPTK
ncbi:hypothetical protein [Xanthomonas phage XPP1]|uniref:Uncharacterized protein n=1 Tax=Xanthomonas phage XPP1 TaxID=2099853 RepID=A0A3S7I615_9CAUD|nr:hypothetical protein KEM11_gp14 [Xanthomonas phage XPP1]AVO23783.1 hypothetical protein [Xanthomonas phage XPP2]AVO23788.1 hypothetical protein [Xanthomonas phage XPP3]AVO23878.1 hypothetical protein [Xanthomonas phage XPP4]AVO23987.1 hypothetical protein [Xanthomonas phage XPP6]AVO24096.1 hypothetical protein [Xanthomonas phage XPP9]QRI46314.1 hypothetical protein [Xanthomonas phage X2]